MNTPEVATVLAVRYEPGVLHLLDQTALPHDEVWLQVCDAPALAEAIRSLRVRGAPLIGVAAAYGLAAIARRAADAGGDPFEALQSAAGVVRSARPTAVNLAWSVDRLMDVGANAGPDASEVAGAVEAEASAIHSFETEACRSMGEHGHCLFGSGARVLTHCNTGALATGGRGTAFSVIRTGFEAGRVSLVWVPETRPLLQGSRLTAWELGKLHIPYRLTSDTATGSLFARGLVDGVVVGADRIALNGDTANKVGTYVLAVLAARHGTPFYVVAPSSTVDRQLATGADIPIEERDEDEIRSVLGRQVAPLDAEAVNPAFDVTPAELITAVVTETGVHHPPFRL